MVYQFCCRYLTLFVGVMITLGSPSSVSAVWQQPPHPFPEPGFGTIALSSGVASDGQGQAAVLISSDSTIHAYNYSNGAWSVTPDGTFTATNIVDELDLAMETTGTALGIWADISFVGDTAFFDGTTWSTPANNPMLGFNVVSVAVAMNAPGSGVAVFIDDANVVHASFFSAGAWSAPVNIGTGDGSADVAFSANGTAVAGWQDGPATVVNNFIGGTWQAPVTLDPTGDFSNVGIDANGNALALWESAGGDILASTFNGTTWLASQTIAAGPGNQFSHLSMSSNGTAVTVFVNASNNGFSSSYNGTTWSSPIPFTTDIVAFGPSISVNSHGNALVVWASSAFVLKSAILLEGASTWNPAEVIQAIPPLPGFEAINASLSNNGVGFAAWISRESTTEGKFPFASAMVQPLPPTNVQAATCRTRTIIGDRFVTAITFDPSTSPSVVGYEIRRNGVLIAFIPATGPFVFFDLNRCGNDPAVYSIISLDANETESIPVIVGVS